MVDLVNDDRPDVFREGRPRDAGAGRAARGGVSAARAGGDAFVADFDRRLGGRVSRLRDWSVGRRGGRRPTPCGRRSGCAADELDDDEAIDRVMNPARNRYRVDMLNVSYHSPMMRALHHAVLRVREAAEPHGRFAGSAPPHGAGVAAADDLCRHHGARVRHAAADPAESRGAGGLRAGDAGGVDGEEPAAARSACRSSSRSTCCPTPRRCGWSNRASFIALQHKWTLRTCFNAQEEIYLASMDEIAQVRDVHPRLARFLGPPCVLRNKIVVAALHRRHALLRRAGLEQLPARRAAALSRGARPAADSPGSRTSTRRSAPSRRWRRRWRCSPATSARRSSGSALAIFIDATDGLLARALRVKERLPWFDGALLDNIIDYLTYVFVPVLLMLRAGAAAGRRWELRIGVRGADGQRLRLQPDRREGRDDRAISSPAFRPTGTSSRCISTSGGCRR